MKFSSSLLMLFNIMVIFSCSPKDDKPSDLLSEQQMRDILICYSLSKHAAAINPHDLTSPSGQNHDSLILSQVLQKHHVTVSKLSESHHYYATHDEHYQTILTMVQDSLTRQLDILRQ